MLGPKELHTRFSLNQMRSLLELSLRYLEKQRRWSHLHYLLWRSLLASVLEVTLCAFPIPLEVLLLGSYVTLVNYEHESKKMSLNFLIVLLIVGQPFLHFMCLDFKEFFKNSFIVILL